MVAVIQLAITLGAAGGGVAFDAWGPATTFAGSAAVLTFATLAAVLASRSLPRGG